MRTGSTKPEWDTPPDGDFASYVERLTAPTPVRVASPAASSAANPSTRPAAGAPASLAPSLPPDLAQVFAQWRGGLRIARVVMLFLTGLHGIALLFFGWGSLAGVIFMGMVWWGLGWFLDMAPKTQRTPGTVVRAGTESLQERLRQVDWQRNSGKKK